MEDKPHILTVMDLLPGNKPPLRPGSTLPGPGREAAGAEASARAMHEVRRSILRKLAPCFHKASQLSSHTE
jgi:hypothetical protein